MSHPRILVNGVQILMPSEHGWIPSGEVGTGGNGQIVVSSIWIYELAWDLLEAAEFNKIWAIWWANQSDEITAYLPKIGDADYDTFQTYTCVINPVTHSGLFEGAYVNVRTSLAGIDIS